MRQLVYTIFIANNHASFQNLENLVKHEQVSKYHEHECLQNFPLIFMFLLTAPIFKNSLILARNYFILLKKRPTPNLKSLQYQIWISVEWSEK